MVKDQSLSPEDTEIGVTPEEWEGLLDLLRNPPYDDGDLEDWEWL